LDSQENDNNDKKSNSGKDNNSNNIHDKNLSKKHKNKVCRKCPYVEYRDGIQAFCGVCHREIFTEIMGKFKKTREEIHEGKKES
jgi:hypothetical protein